MKLKTSFNKYELCECIKSKDMSVIIMCGCGKRHCRLYRDHVVHWLDLDWRIECAFDYAVKNMTGIQIK